MTKKYLRSTLHWFWPPGDASWWRRRLSVKADLAWQPFLFTAVFWGAVITLVYRWLDIMDVDPPGKDIDSIEGIWLWGALTAPVLGYVSVQVIQHGSGRWRYAALWCRLAADIGVATSLLCFGLRRFFDGPGHPFGQAILIACVSFLVFLTVRDVKFLIATEHLASYLTRRDDEG